MKSLTLILATLILSISVRAQTPDNDALFGTFNVRNDAARICLATAGPSSAPWCWSSMGFEWHNGPPGDEDYLNHTSGFSYNSDFVGNKIVPGLVNYTLSTESKYRNGRRGEPGVHMTEFHLNWCNPDGSICIRPASATVQYDTGKFDLAIHGKMHFFRDFVNGGDKWGTWHDDGALDLSEAPNGRIAFKNNTWGLLWQNSRKDNSVAPLLVDDRDRVVIGGGQQETVINSAKLIYTHPQCGAIPDSNGTDADNARAINSLLSCLRTNGLLPQSRNLKVVQELPVCVGEMVQQSSQPKKANSLKRVQRSGRLMSTRRNRYE